jgi:hypothetical protein
MRIHPIDIAVLNTEMYYQPLWQKDKLIIISILHTVHYTRMEIKAIARLYIRYQHMMHKTETGRCFDWLLNKASCQNFEELCKLTQAVYNQSNL